MWSTSPWQRIDMSNNSISDTAAQELPVAAANDQVRIGLSGNGLSAHTLGRAVIVSAEALAEVGCWAGPVVGSCRPDWCLLRP